MPNVSNSDIISICLILEVVIKRLELAEEQAVDGVISEPLSAATLDQGKMFTVCWASNQLQSARDLYDRLFGMLPEDML
jgi:hypothetical protein